VTARLVLVVLVGCAAALHAQVPFDRILQSGAEPHHWLTYSGNVQGHRHSPLTQITPANVRDLELQWVFQAESLEKFEATPLVVDGVLYTVQPPNDVVAIDAATGRIFWTYSHTPSPQARACCGRVNRGLALLDDTLYLGTFDGRLLALDAKSGRPVWNVPVDGARVDAGYVFTMAPLVIKNTVLMAAAGGDFGIRGFLAAFDAKTGREVWRFHTIPGPGEPGNETWAGDSWMRGGGGIWVTGTYDPDLNLTYWGIGNPGPDFNGDSRAGDNLYSNSVVALDADTGRLRWHFQFTPHDEFDYDATQVPVLADIEFRGRQRRAMLWANRNGFWYVLDRVTGEFLFGAPFTKVTWADGLDAKGRPNRVQHPTPEGFVVYPSFVGATNWYSPSYSPRTGLFYVPAWMDTHSTFIKGPAQYVEGRSFIGTFPTGPSPSIFGSPINRRVEGGHGAVLALDPRTGETRWQFDMTDVTDSGVLTTATDLVFSGSREGDFFALDARSGALLWRTSLGGTVQSGPMSYAVGGRQYVAVSAGHALFAFALEQR
jgi:alcohol dehydrogenase (cytochrome c)